MKLEARPAVPLSPFLFASLFGVESPNLSLVKEIVSYIDFKLTIDGLHLKLMDLGLKVFSFLSGAAKSNFYGLACPFYCTQPSVSLVLLSFLVGAILGACLTALAFFGI